MRERTLELVQANERLTHEMEQRKKAERQLLQTQKLEAIGRLAGGIAHDFNNLMAVVLGSGGLLAKRIELRLDPDAGAVRADRGQLEQVVMNLVVNARDAMAGGGTVTLATGRELVTEARSLELGGIEAGDVATAIRAATTQLGPIDMLLTDVLLPNGSGPELAERLALLRPEARPLFMSGYADDALLARARGRSAAFIAKPFTPDALATKVREVLG